MRTNWRANGAAGPTLGMERRSRRAGRLRRALALGAAGLSLTSGLALLPAASNASATPIYQFGDTFPIEDNAGSVDSIVVPGGLCLSPINDVNVHIEWEHTANVELNFSITSPSGDSAELMIGEGGASDDGEVLFDDEAERSITNVGSPESPNGWFIPLDSLQTFDGEDPTGQWSLVVLDIAEADTGQVLDWNLELNCFRSSGDVGPGSFAVTQIPDGGTATDTVNVTQPCASITDVDVDVVYQHGEVDDLRFELTHGGTTVVLWDADIQAERGGVLRFDDDATATVDDIAAIGEEFDAWPVDVGPTKPQQALTAFDGMDGTGPWTLRAVDTEPLDEGEIQQFGIRPTCAGEEPPPAPGGDPCDGAPADAFTDDDTSVHEDRIDCLAFLGITTGGPAGLPAASYGPRLQVRRDQMASFIARAASDQGVALPASPPDAFDDDDGTTHELRINQLAALGVIGGNGENGRSYGYARPINRAEMASFLAGFYEVALGAPLPPGSDAFPDDESSPHEADINGLAAAGIVQGRTDGTYGPAAVVFRDSMASFIVRTVRFLETGEAGP